MHYVINDVCVVVIVGWQHTLFCRNSTTEQTNAAGSRFPGNPQLPTSRPRLAWSLSRLLSSGQVFLLDDSSHVASLDLPATFWDPDSNVAMAPHLVRQFENDLNW
jgi:hypothetical protein